MSRQSFPAGPAREPGSDKQSGLAGLPKRTDRTVAPGQTAGAGQEAQPEGRAKRCGPAADIGSCAVFKWPRSSTTPRLFSASGLSTNGLARLTRWYSRHAAGGKISVKAAVPRQPQARPNCGWSTWRDPAWMNCFWITKTFCVSVGCRSGTKTRPRHGGCGTWGAERGRQNPTIRSVRSV